MSITNSFLLKDECIVNILENPNALLCDTVCQYCDATFISRYAWGKHVVVDHLNVKNVAPDSLPPPQVCPLCNSGKSFKNNVGLYRHFRHWHSLDGIQVYTCAYCCIKAKRLDTIKRHLERSCPVKQRNLKLQELATNMRKYQVIFL